MKGFGYGSMLRGSDVWVEPQQEGEYLIDLPAGEFPYCAMVSHGLLAADDIDEEGHVDGEVAYHNPTNQVRPTNARFDGCRNSGGVSKEDRRFPDDIPEESERVVDDVLMAVDPIGRPTRAPVAAHIRGKHAPVLSEGRQDGDEVLPSAHEAMEQHYRRPVPRMDGVVDGDHRSIERQFCQQSPR